MIFISKIGACVVLETDPICLRRIDVRIYL